MSQKEYVRLLENCALGFEPVQLDYTGEMRPVGPGRDVENQPDLPFDRHRHKLESSELLAAQHVRRVLSMEQEKISNLRAEFELVLAKQLEEVKVNGEQELRAEAEKRSETSKELEDMRKAHGGLAALEDRLRALREEEESRKSYGAQREYIRLRQRNDVLRKEIESGKEKLYVAKRRFATKKRKLRELKRQARALSKDMTRLRRESAELREYLDRSQLTAQDEEFVAVTMIQALFRRVSAAVKVEKGHRILYNLQPLVALLRRKIVLHTMILERNLEELDSINENVEPELMCDLCFLTLRQPEISPETGRNCCRRCLKDVGKYGSVKVSKSDRAPIPNNVLSAFMKSLKKKAATFQNIAQSSEELRSNLLRSSLQELLAHMR